MQQQEDVCFNNAADEDAVKKATETGRPKKGRGAQKKPGEFAADEDAVKKATRQKKGRGAQKKTTPAATSASAAEAKTKGEAGKVARGKKARNDDDVFKDLL